MSRLDTTSTSAHLWSGWIILVHHSQKSKFCNLRPCMAILIRFCYQSYHQTGVTSCTVIIHPWCFTVFTGIHHCCPPLALRAATGTIVLNPCLGGSKTRCRHGELPVVQRKHRGLSVVSWSLSRHASHYTSLSSKSSALFHNKGVQTHEQSDTIRTKLEQKNDNQHPKKHVETRWNMFDKRGDTYHKSEW